MYLLDFFVMRFKLVEDYTNVPSLARDCCYLVHTKWDDWFAFETMYVIYYFDCNSVRSPAFEIKIGECGLKGQDVDHYRKSISRGENVCGIRTPTLPKEFQALPENFFSIGGGDAYYEFFGQSKERRIVLSALNDMAHNQVYYRRNKNEKCLSISLMRGISVDRLKNRFAKLAHGKPALTDFEFTYKYPKTRNTEVPDLLFSVSTSSNPPSNIKVVIGRNGVGKTHLLKCIAASICGLTMPIGEGNGRIGKVEFVKGSVYGVVYASFSAFDSAIEGREKGPIAFHRIGVERNENVEGMNVQPMRTLSEKFSDALVKCRTGPFRGRWLSCLEILKSDPIFAMLEGERLLDGVPSEIRRNAIRFFNALSSGHAALMLIVSQLVCLLDEKFLVLIDEPECHLHPPLLSSFIRCLTFLLQERNAIAFIATHSPVVLQEVTRDSVWILDRRGYDVELSHPRVETFGEGLGLLLNDVFGLEMRSSGYHCLLREAVDEGGKSYRDIINSFGGHLGLEAKAILRVMLACRDRNTDA